MFSSYMHLATEKDLLFFFFKKSLPEVLTPSRSFNIIFVQMHNVLQYLQPADHKT